MPRRPRIPQKPTERAPRAAPRAETLAWWIVAVTVFLTAVAAVAAGDTFRLPKEAIARVAAIALLALAAVTFLWNGRPDWLSLRRRWAILPAAAAGWALITFAFANNYKVSVVSLLDVLAGTTIFLFMVATARKRSTAILAALFAAALANALVLLLQLQHLWEPFRYTLALPDRLRRTALLGNPDDVGTYFAVVSISAIALVIVSRGWLRALAAVTAVASLASIAAVQTLTAAAAVAAGLVALTFIVLWRKRAIAIAVLVVLVAGAIVGLMTTGTGLRVREIGMQLAQGHMPATLVGRMYGTLAALRMFSDNPILGVGPGCFAWEYFPYRLKIDEQWPELRGVSQENYGEAHNDHAQLLAEGGLPGYLIFLAALAGLGAVSFRGHGNGDERARWARLAALPTAVTAAVLSAGLFPLHMASVRFAILFVVAAVVAWRLDAEPAA